MTATAVAPDPPTAAGDAHPRPPVRRFALALGLLTALALAWRVGYVVVVKGDPPDACGLEVCGDAIWYTAQASEAAGGSLFVDPFTGEPTADHPPLTSIVAAVGNLVVDGTFVQRLVMAVVGAGAVVVIGLLGRAVGGDRVGLLAAGLAAAYPNLWMNDVIVMAEALTALLVAAVLLVVYRYRAAPSTRGALLAGALVGLAALARSEQVLLGVLIVAPAVWWARVAPEGAGGGPGSGVGDGGVGAGTGVRLPVGDRLRHLVVAGGAALVVVAPWIGWNLTRFDEPTTLSTNDGLTLLGANCDEVYDGPAVGFWSLNCGIDVDAEGDGSVLSAARRDKALEYISNHQTELPRVVVFRVARVWSLYQPGEMVWFNVGEGREKWASWAGFWAYVALVPLAALGTWRLRRAGVAVWPLLMTGVVVTLTAVLFYGIVRFRVPAEVAIVVLAAAGLEPAWTWVRSRAGAGVSGPGGASTRPVAGRS